MGAKLKTLGLREEEPQDITPFVPQDAFNDTAKDHLAVFAAFIIQAWAEGIPAEGITEDGAPNHFDMDPLDYMHHVTSVSLVAPHTLTAAFLPPLGKSSVLVNRAIDFFNDNEEGLDLDAFLFFALHREIFTTRDIVEIRRAFWNHSLDHYPEVTDREDKSPDFQMTRLLISNFLLPKEKDTLNAIKRHWKIWLKALEVAMQEENLQQVQQTFVPDDLDEAGNIFRAKVARVAPLDDTPSVVRHTLAQECRALSKASALAEGMTILASLVREDQREQFQRSPALLKLIARLERIVKKGMEGQSISSEAFVSAAKSLTLLTASAVSMTDDGKLFLVQQTGIDDA